MAEPFVLHLVYSSIKLYDEPLLAWQLASQVEQVLCHNCLVQIACEKY